MSKRKAPPRPTPSGSLGPPPPPSRRVPLAPSSATSLLDLDEVREGGAAVPPSNSSAPAATTPSAAPPPIAPPPPASAPPAPSAATAAAARVSTSGASSAPGVSVPPPPPRRNSVPAQAKAPQPPPPPRLYDEVDDEDEEYTVAAQLPPSTRAQSRAPSISDSNDDSTQIATDINKLRAQSAAPPPPPRRAAKSLAPSPVSPPVAPSPNSDFPAIPAAVTAPQPPPPPSFRGEHSSDSIGEHYAEPFASTSYQGAGYPAVDQFGGTATGSKPVVAPRASSMGEGGLSPKERRALTSACEAELEAHPSPTRAARLHYELGRLSANDADALKHYQRALALHPEHLPSLRAASSLMLRLRNTKGASELFDDQVRLAADPRTKARLCFEKGRAIEDIAGDLEGARACYRRAAELDPMCAVYIKALHQAERYADNWSGLARAYEMAANALRDDNVHRAALIVRRAQLHDTRLNDTRGSIELYEQALDVNPGATGAVHGLKRLLHQESRWRELAQVLEREANQASHPTLKARALYDRGRVLSERLGSAEDGVRALSGAVDASPDDELALDVLARHYERMDEPRRLAEVLAQLVETIGIRSQRLGLLHRIGELHEKRLSDDSVARRWYELALKESASYEPALVALDRLYERSQAWQSLVVMYGAAADAMTIASRRAHAHARIGEVNETRLNQLDEAVKHHAKALALDPTYESSFKALVRLFQQLARHHELIELYERGIDGAENQADLQIAYLFKIGWLYEDCLQDPAQAIHAYQRILRLSPKSLGAIHALQRACERAYRHDDHVSALQREVDNTQGKTRRVGLLQRAGEILLDDANNKEEALIQFRRVLELDSTHLPALTRLATLYHDMGRYEDLIGVLQRECEAAEKGTAQAELHFRIAEVAANQLRESERAISHYRLAIKANEAHQPSLRGLSNLLTTKGDFKALVSVLRNEIQAAVRPMSKATAAIRLGEVHELHLEQPREAISVYEEALEHVPNYQPAVEAIGRVQTALKEWRFVAEGLIDEAARLADPRLSVEALLRAGELYSERLDDNTTALTTYERVLSLQSDNLAAYLAIEPLYRAAQRWDDLYRCYEGQLRVLTDQRAKMAVLEEMIRLLATYGVGTVDDQRERLQQMLLLDDSSTVALYGLAGVAEERDDAILSADIYARLASVEKDPALVAVYYVRLGEALAKTDPNSSEAAFRRALEFDSENISAIRGLRRAAASIGDAKGIVEAYRREANWTQDGESAADVLVRSARVRLDRMGDPEGATEDAERALERAPHHVEAASLLSSLLSGDGSSIDRLISRLTRAATDCDLPSRRASLWCQVARIYADQKNDVAAGLAALERMMQTSQRDATALQLQGDLYRRNRQWREAAEAYSKAVHTNPPIDLMVPLRFELGKLYAQQLSEPLEAIGQLRALIGLDNRHRDGLTLLVSLQLANGDGNGARTTVRHLIVAASKPEERALAYFQLGKIELSQDRRKPAAQALREAVSFEGPLGEAAKLYKGLLGDVETWEQYVDTLKVHLSRIQNAEINSATMKDTYLALSRVEHEVLLKPDAASATLREALTVCGDDVDLRLSLAERLSASGNIEGAHVEYQTLIAADPLSPDAWRGLARAFRKANSPIHAAVALGPLVLSKIATDEEESMSKQRRVRTGNARPGTLAPGGIQRITAAEPYEENRILAVLSAVNEAFIKLYPLNLDRYGVSLRDKVPENSEHISRVLCDRLAGAFGVRSYDLFVHHGSRVFDVMIEFGAVPTVMVPTRVFDLPEPQQVFLLTRAFCDISRGTMGVSTLGASEIVKVLIAVTRQYDVTFDPGDYTNEELAPVAKQVHRALSRKTRKIVETAIIAAAQEPQVDYERWVATLETTNTRVAALVSQDLPASVELIRHLKGAPAQLEVQALVRRLPSAADLLRFWASDAAFQLRASAGLV